MNTTEINRLVEHAVAEIKAVNSGYRKKDRKDKLPDFNPIYRRTVELKERIEIHTELDKKPLEMMEKRAPYEDDMQYKYRKENWNSVTMPYFSKALGKLNRIMNPSNYSINFSAEQAIEKEYFATGIPSSSAIETYFEQIVLYKKILDPNALLVVKPFYLPTKEVETEDGIVLVYDQTEAMPVAPVVIDCQRVIEFKEDVFAMIELLEKSKVDVGGKIKREGLMFEIYDQNNIWRVEQIGKKEKYEFSEPYLYYSHNLGYLPAQKLKGFPKQDDVYVYYQSYFIDAIPNLDTALYLNSNLDMSMVNHMIPQRVEQMDRCDDQDCNGRGYLIEYYNEQEIRRPCQRCKGTGSLSRTGPMMVKQLQVPDGMTPGDTATNYTPPGIWYVSPDAGPLEFVDKKFEKLVESAFLFINMDVSTTEVKGSETALGKQIDREELFSFLMRISNELFDLLEFTIKAIGEMRYTNFKMPEISAPTSFQIRSEYDLMEELIEAKKAGLPEIALREIIVQTMATRFSSQIELEKATNLIMATDRIVTMSNIEAQGAVAAGLAHKWEYVLHVSAGAFIEQLVVENENFFMLDPSEQQKQLIDKAKAVEKGLTVEKGSVSKILEIANAPAA